MAVWVCTGCTAAYSVGAPRCPQCGGTEYAEEGQDGMAKITVHGGLSNAAAPQTDDEEGPSPTPEVPGISSSTSSMKDEPSPETSESAHPRRARTTGSRSKRAQTGSSSASGTGGVPAGGTSATSSDEA